MPQPHMENTFIPYLQNGLGNLELLAKAVVEGFLTGLHAWGGNGG